MTGPRIAAHAPDLMDQSKIRGALDNVSFVRRVDALASTEADVVLVDLNRPGVLDVVGAISATVIGFGSHVDDELLDAARAAGCDEVLARSVFFSRLARGALTGDTAAGDETATAGVDDTASDAADPVQAD